MNKDVRLSGFKIEVLSVPTVSSVLDCGTKESMYTITVANTNPKDLQKYIVAAQKEIVLGGKLIDEVARQLVVTLEFSEHMGAPEINSVFSTIFNVAPVIPTIAGVFFHEKLRDRTTVYAVFNDCSDKVLFSYFPDELTFTENELIGLTEQQAKDLFTKKDLDFLRY